MYKHPIFSSITMAEHHQEKDGGNPRRINVKDDGSKSTRSRMRTPTFASLGAARTPQTASTPRRRWNSILSTVQASQWLAAKSSARGKPSSTRRARGSTDLATSEEGAEVSTSLEDSVEDLKRKKPHLLFILQSPIANRSAKEHDVVLKEVSELGFFRQFSLERQQALSRILRLQYGRPGDVLLKAGSLSPCVYVIFHGLLEVSEPPISSDGSVLGGGGAAAANDDGQHASRLVRRSGSFDTLATRGAAPENLVLLPGDVAGAELLTPGAGQCTRTVRSIGDSILLKIEVATFREISNAWKGFILSDTLWCPVATGKALETAERSPPQVALIQRVLTSHAFFGQFEDNTVKSLAACVRLRRLEKSGTLSAAPEADETLYFVSDGQMSSAAGHRFVAGDAFHLYGEGVEFTADETSSLLEITSLPANLPPLMCQCTLQQPIPVV